MLLTAEIVGVFMPAVVLFLIAVSFGIAIMYLGKRFAVQGDSRTEEIRKLLPSANCGACGLAGCDDFASSLAKGEVKLGDCTVLGGANRLALSKMLSDESGSGFTETVAVVCCNGGNSCKNKYDYQGYGDCRTAEMLAEGRKACPVGCVGLGTCVDFCHYFAVDVGQEGVSRVIAENCTSCGMCIKACPKNIIKRIPKSAGVYIACSNHGKGKEVREICSRGCIGCGICAKSCPENAITMNGMLPEIDYSKCTGCGVCVEKCPVKCILYHGSAASSAA